MSEGSGKPDGMEPSDNDETVTDIEPSSDLVLEVLAASSGDDGGFGVTLSVAGGVITGQLVSARGWFRRVQAELLAAGPNHETTGLESLVEHLEGLRDPDAIVRNVHLINAQWMTSSALLPANGCLWRGRLSQVSGWALGTAKSL